MRKYVLFLLVAIYSFLNCSGCTGRNYSDISNIHDLDSSKYVCISYNAGTLSGKTIIVSDDRVMEYIEMLQQDYIDVRSSYTKKQYSFAWTFYDDKDCEILTVYIYDPKTVRIGTHFYQLGAEIDFSSVAPRSS